MLRSILRVEISSKMNSTQEKTSVSFLKPYNFLITRCGRSKKPYFRFMRTSCTRYWTRDLSGLALLFKIKHFSHSLLYYKLFNNDLILFFPFFSRKISKQTQCENNLVENILIVSSSLIRKQDKILASTKTLKNFYLTSS